MITYSDGGKVADFNNLRFIRDDNTGYYLNSTNRIRLHRYVWSVNSGEIPEGYHIHHIDGDKNNNELDNLELLDSETHLSYHAKKRVRENQDWLKKFQENGIKKAPEWHASEEGRAWHREHYKRTADKLYRKDEFICLFCGKEYTAVVSKFNRYCSNKCKSAERRASGVDDIERRCECGEVFIANKYSTKKRCNRSCKS